MSSKIKELREITGAGMMECNNALKESNGDVEKAIQYLREKGMASLRKRSGNATNNGNFGIYDSSSRVAIVELLSETDFVANSEVFRNAANSLASHIAQHGYQPGQTLQEVASQAILDVLMPLKENISLGTCAVYDKSQGPVYHYIHDGGQNRIAGVVQLGHENPNGRSIAVHIACNLPSPIAVNPEDISPADVAEEVQYSGSDENKARKSLSLLGAPFLKDPSTTIQAILGDNKVLSFVRIKIG